MATVLHKNLTGDALHEPKGAATAPAGAIYVADGAGSGYWTPGGTAMELTGLCLYPTTPGQTAVVSAGQVNTDVLFSLSYTADLNTANIAYDNTTKVITFGGVRPTTIQLVAVFSLALTTGTNVTLTLKPQMSTDGGTVWVDKPQSITARKFPNADVGNMVMSCSGTFNPGDKLRFVRKADAACTFTVTNININLQGIG